MCSRARGKRPPVYCRCYDDFDCFQPAQQNLLHTIATAPGCVVVLTGDFHFSDIKVNIISNDFEPQKCLALTCDVAFFFSCRYYRPDQKSRQDRE